MPKLEIQTPTTPNFIKYGENFLSISKFSDEELREIGKKWTDNLLKKAKSKR